MANGVDQPRAGWNRTAPMGLLRDQLRHQPRAADLLLGGIARGQLHHGLLFAGPEGVGKEATARAYAQALDCETAPGEGCGSCGECRRIALHSHSDVVWVMPDAERVARKLAGRADFSETPSREIKVSQVRQLMERLALKSLHARRKFALFLKAERMNVAAQNALLKTLEEPPPDTTLVLITHAPDALLATIRSRLMRVPFAPLPMAAVAEAVQRESKLSPERALLAARLAQGSLPRALTFDEARLAERSALVKGLAGLLPDDARPALLLAEQWGKDRATAEASLDLLELWLRDVALLASGAGSDGIANIDLEAELQQAAQRTGTTRALSQLEAVTAARRKLERNAGARFVLERLFLEGLA